ncbi:hypothetical protein EVAR_3144_1 [Eumeta japonica]|uniref:Uncharacterized protein n=1 Tax=Eumeta variegata TaxID=151549 RepID=A0A4C1XHG8_EUMVA|nr:hypothetical protein EVAR_3144_1 [Eumeta japonica]
MPILGIHINHAPTASHADRPRQMKSSKFQIIGTTDNGQPSGRFGVLVRESRTPRTRSPVTDRIARFSNFYSAALSSNRGSCVIFVCVLRIAY